MSQQQAATVHELASSAGVPLQNLDYKCSDCDLKEFSELCDPWELAASHLGLTEPQISAIREDNTKTEVRRLKLLQKWKECMTTKATYKTLIEAFLKCKLTQQALYVCEYLKNHQLSISHDGAVGTGESEDECVMSQKQQNDRSYAVSAHQTSEHRIRRNARESLRMIDRKFASVQRQLIAADGVTLEKLKLYVATFPSFKPDYSASVLDSTSTLEFFHKLKDYCNTQNPDILEDLVEALGDNKTRRELKEFIHEYKTFQRTTKLKDLVGTFEGLVEFIPLADTVTHKELEIRLKDDWEEKTVEDLEKLKDQLSSRAWCLRIIEKKSLIVTYLIPRFEHIQVEKLEGYLCRHNVLQIIMDGKCIFNYDGKDLLSVAVQITII